MNFTTSSSQQMQTIDRLVLQKEDMQTNGTLPPSTDQNKFENVDMNDHVLGWMNELWNKWKGYMHVKYILNMLFTLNWYVL
ncbi:hypothetical protein H5410_036349 [Solanum commersonii]|uniref:Uncharacterized protein n=1 Tax=Solanum commersonii TaxID=4109 RepID=A0A9J5Y4J1_SOLCO|nr:hypothetical protein H5410_036349 [Solanum commersonii]